MEVSTQIFDLAGQSIDDVRDVYFRGASGVILIYDVSNPTSFQTLNTWMQKLQEQLDQMRLSGIALVGNKLDLEIKVGEEQIREFVDRWEANFDIFINVYQISCKIPEEGEQHPKDLIKDFISSIIYTMMNQTGSNVDKIRLVKTILAGSDGVGKTTFKNRILGSGFQQEHLMTIGADFSTLDIDIPETKLSKSSKKRYTSDPKPSENINHEAVETEEKRQEEKNIGKKLDQPTTRNVGINYYDRVNPRKNFDLTVELSESEIDDISAEDDFVRSTRKTQKKDKLEFEQKLVIISPVWPGCIVSPPQRTVDLSNESQRVQFSISPLVKGEIDGKVEFRNLNNRILHIIDTPAISKDTKIAKTVAYSGTIFGITPPEIESLLGVEINSFLQNRLQQQLPWLKSIFGQLNWMLLIEGIIILGSILTVYGLYKKFAPRRNDIDAQVDQVQLE